MSFVPLEVQCGYFYTNNSMYYLNYLHTKENSATAKSNISTTAYINKADIICCTKFAFKYCFCDLKSY